jgi:signal transduction histidine kinase/DNA-binding NarL/FixJ family response regulator
LQERLGVELQVVPDITWPQILAGARNRKIDLIACVSKTPARRAFLHFTHPYLSFPIVILTRTQTPFISAIGDLYGKKVSVVKDYAPYESLIRDHSAVITSVVNSPLEGLQQVSTGASEAYIGNLAVCTYLMQQHHITNLKVAAPAVGIASTNFSMGVRSDWPELVSILNKALQSITPPERNAIATKWMAVRYEYAVNWGRMMRISGGILGVGVLILSGFFYWNRKLSKEIAVRKTIEIQLKEAKQEAERANKAKSIFLANMSHEIRTPMNAILGYSQLMQHDIGLSSNHKKNLSIINNSGEHLLSLINDILEMSKIEAGRIDIQPSDFDLWALLDDLKMMFYVHANAKKIKLEVYRSKAVPQYIVTDEAKLRQVLINLLGNAIKFTDEGKVSLKTKAYLTPESDVTLNNNSLHLSFIISDTGVGMSSEDLQKIFINFEQTEIGRGREGTGLGLSISREYIRFLGGDISVSSELGKGSTFHVSLTTAMGCAADRPENELSSRIIGIEEKHSFFRILVVDDKSTNRDLLVEILSRVGFEVKEAVNGLQAIELCNTFNPHLVMMDIRMPVMDGVTATQKIKSDSINNKITIIAVSASALEDQRIRVLEHGADAFIRKPFKENVVLEEIKKHLHLNYIYSDTTSATEISNQKTSFDAIKHLPIDLIKKMQLATEGGYHKELLTLIETIDGIDPATANALRRLADEYDYDQLLNQFNAHLE